MFYFVFFGSFILCFSAVLFCLFRVLCFLPVLLSPVPRQHTLHIRSAHGVRGMDLHGVKGLPLHQPVQQFDGIATLICKISQVMVEIQYFDLDAVSLRLPDQCLGFIQIFIASRSFSLIQAFQICFDPFFTFHEPSFYIFSHFMRFFKNINFNT